MNIIENGKIDVIYQHPYKYINLSIRRKFYEVGRFYVDLLEEIVEKYNYDENIDVTGVNYNVCIVIAMIVLTILTVISGSKGVLITDTIMAAIFTIAMIIGVICISKSTGG